jgi:hypothetical protein
LHGPSDDRFHRLAHHRHDVRNLQRDGRLHGLIHQNRGMIDYGFELPAHYEIAHSAHYQVPFPAFHENLVKQTNGTPEIAGYTSTVRFMAEKTY